MTEAGEISAKVETAELVVATVTDQELDKINKNRLERLMAVWGVDEEQCMERFAPAGLFDFRWLVKQAIFKKLKKEQRL